MSVFVTLAMLPAPILCVTLGVSLRRIHPFDISDITAVGRFYDVVWRNWSVTQKEYGYAVSVHNLVMWDTWAQFLTIDASFISEIAHYPILRWRNRPNFTTMLYRFAKYLMRCLAFRTTHGKLKIRDEFILF